MFLKFFIKIEGDSMSPSIDNKSFVLAKSFKKKINKFFIFKQNLWKLVKKLVKIDSSNHFWFEGASI